MIVEKNPLVTRSVAAETVVDVDRSTKPARPDATSHLGFIDGIRALAALFVVVHHAFYEPTKGFYESKLLNHLGLAYGHIAVDVFIVISGFCLMLPMARRGGAMGSIAEFYKRRARRILPPYYAALFLSVLFILVYAHEKTNTYFDMCLPLTWPTFLKHLVLLHDFPLPGNGGSINYPLWSIAVEFQLYLLMPLIALSLRRWSSGITLAWTVLLGFALHFGLHGLIDDACPWYLGLFTMGAVAAKQAITAPRTRVGWLRGATYGLWLVAFLLTVAKGKAFFLAHLPFYDTVFGALTALLLYGLLVNVSERQGLLSRALSWKPLVFVGTFSYSLYLLHAPLLHLFDRLLTPYLKSGPLLFGGLVAATPLIVGIAYLFHLAFERPFMSTRSVPKSAAA